MSDQFIPFGESGPDEGEPLGAGAGDGQSTDQFAPEEPPRSYLELDDDVASRYVRVKADGQELEVPLSEALNGYSRQADYTQKTQALAAQRQEAEYALAVQRALQAQPEEALRLLARQYGVNFEQQLPQQQPSYQDEFDDNPYADPVERKLAAIERQQAQLNQQWQQRQADEQLRTAVGGLQQRYQLDDSTVREVVSSALQMGMGPESFDMIYENLAFDRAQAARQQAAQQAAATQSQRQASAAQAGQLIGSGASATRAAVPPAPASNGAMSISEAFNLAAAEHGI